MNNLEVFFQNFCLAEKGKDIYLFGNGIVAYYVAKYFIEKGMHIHSFCVSDKGTESVSYFGIPVIKVSQIQKANAVVVVSVMENLHEEIVETLRQNSIRNVYFLSDSNYMLLREIYCDCEAELYRSIHNIEKATIREQKLLMRGAYMKSGACHHQIYKKEYDEVRRNDDYEFLLSRLVDGLDERSKLEIYRIIHRLNLLCDSEDIEFTRQELQDIDLVRQGFQQNIFNLGNKMIYNNFVFPVGAKLEASTLWYENGIREIKSLSDVGDKSIIDAGAYIGDSAVILSSIFAGRIYAFEPEQANYEDLKRVIDWNHLSNVIPIQKVLSDVEKKVTLYVGEDQCCTYNSVKGLINNDNRRKEQKVNSTTIDQFVSENDI